ncbi:MAG: hypothetical protein LBR27_05015 [Bifidobacteriaceae bacterium]|jgi:ABC-type dipeptide/oligopeptide/nickel transport system permease component|nr:hypothetical protein [Bifidobacteriaceae bacterium]
MARYVINRCLAMVIIVLATALIGLTILVFMRGDPARTLLGSPATAACAEPQALQEVSLGQQVACNRLEQIA